ncbi:MAG TPA: type II CRISPR-associated endonuclease Cas1 [Candidatus Cloacimonadota bacterium]|nr:type II CRISPR-associated endonuclease Cas1 [Candidatus Cloacimonadota bacterium]
MASTLELSSGSVFISVSRGFLLVKRDTEEQKIPLADLDCVILSSPAVSISSQAMSRLAEENIPIIHCGKNAMPIAMTLAYADNVYRKERVMRQIDTSLPLKKRLWQQIVRAKIQNQGSVISLIGAKANEFIIFADKTLSGDSGNMEAVAARRYWGRLFGKGFKRDPEEPGRNSLLNYGYAILRAAVARSIVGAGLIPDLGLEHCNMMNPYCLADDLMEPYRPLIDLCVWSMFLSDGTELSPINKRILITMLEIELVLEGNHASMRNCVDTSVRSYVRSLYNKKTEIIYPGIDEETAKLLKEVIINARK